jgi:DNA-binding GntR family transcriptional regulator
VDAQGRAREVANAVARWDADARPLYVALANALSVAIELGLVPEQLPSERALAPELHVSRATVALAYEALRERGIVDRERGSGTRVRRAPARRVCADPLGCIRTFFAPY